MPGIMAAAIGRDIESIYQGNNRGVLADVDLLQRITEACRACVREFVLERTGVDGRIGQNFLPSLLKWTGFYQEPLTRALQGSEFARADRADLSNTFKYLEFCLEQVRLGLGWCGARCRMAVMVAYCTWKIQLNSVLVCCCIA